MVKKIELFETACDSELFPQLPEIKNHKTHQTVVSTVAVNSASIRFV